MIYLVGQNFDKPFKVGRSKAPERRVKDIQTYTYFPVRLIGQICFEDSESIIPNDVRAEKECHRLLAEYKLHNEWFQCSFEDFESALNKSEEYYIWTEYNLEDDLIDQMIDFEIEAMYG